jgi:tetratricopeptide (TPR) repeat protein
MIEAAFTDDLALLAGALRQEAFRFILINHNRKSIYSDIAQWLREQYPDRPFFELEFRGKDYRRISDELTAIEKGIVLIPDFDWLFHPENEALCIAFNQRRDFFARRPVALICFLQPSNFLLVPKKMPDWWSLRSLELEFHRELLPEDDLPLLQLLEFDSSSLGGISVADKKAEIERLLRQIEVADTENLTLLHSLYSQLGYLYYLLSDYEQAEYFFCNSLILSQKAGQRQEEGVDLNNIGQVYYAQGKDEAALINFHQSLKLRQEIKDQKGEGVTLNNIGQIYYTQGEYKKALRYFHQSLKIREDISDQKGQGVTLNSMSQIYYTHGDYDTALSRLNQSLAIMRHFGEEHEIAIILTNTGAVLLRRDQTIAAITLLVEAYNMFKKNNSPNAQHPKQYLSAILAQIGEPRFKELAGEQASDFLNSGSQVE